MVISIDWVSVVWTFYILYKTLQLSEIPGKKKGGGTRPPLPSPLLIRLWNILKV